MVHSAAVLLLVLLLLLLYTADVFGSALFSVRVYPLAWTLVSSADGEVVSHGIDRRLDCVD